MIGNVIRHCFALLLAIMVTGSGFAMAATERRVALVIGNGAYQFANHLPNPAADAQLMATTLRTGGFEVIEGIDLTKLQMEEVVDRFTELAYTADLALVFYAGHGMQVDGRNYLIPVDAELSSPAHLKTRTIEMERVIGALPIDPAVGVVIIDACRDNPLARSFASTLPATRSSSVNSGLAAVQTQTEGDGSGGLLIGFATDPGAVALDGEGANSPYTTALARHLTAPGVSIQTALTRVRGEVATATNGQQRPWYNASLGREVFAGPAAAPALPETEVAALSPAGDAAAESGPRSPATAGEWEVEQRVWDDVSRANTVEHYEFYLSRFPQGHFRAIAELNIKHLREQASTQQAAVQPGGATDAPPQTRMAVAIPEDVRTTPGTEATDDMLGLSRPQRSDLQLRLKSLGFDPKGVDGGIGPNSRRAISAWQASNAIVETGYLTAPQYEILVTQSEPFVAAARREHEQQQQAAAATRQRQQVTRQAGNQPQRKTQQQQQGGSGGMNDVGKVMLGVGAGIIACKVVGC